jgi:beta-glucuronidase
LFLLLERLLLPDSFAGTPKFLENGASSSGGGEASFLAPSSTRLKIPLNGYWTYSLEDGESGTVSVPGAYDFTGKVDLQRTFEIKPEDLDRYQFHVVFYGSNYSTDVFVNGEFLGNHQGGYTSYSQAIPREVLQPGKENLIRVVVKNDLDARTTLPLRHPVWGWRNYGGVHRDVYLLATPRLFIKDAAVVCEVAANGTAARFVVSPRVEGVEKAISLPASPDKQAVLGMTVEIVEALSGMPVARSPVVPVVREGESWKSGQLEAAMQNPRLWSPESPDLYRVKCVLVSTSGKDVTVLDELQIPVGVRTLNIERGDLVLNGRRLFVKGVAWYEDHPSWGNAIPYEERERDVVLMKNLGANTIRFVNHPPHPCMLDLCDRYGLLAMIDLPLSNSPGAVLAAESYQELAGGILREMVMRDRNHPSVLAWGLGDEVEVSHPAARPFVASMVQLVRSLDGRPTYLALRYGVEDSCADLVDLAAVNIHLTDLKAFKKALEDWRSGHKNKPLLVTKVGSEVQHENRKGYNDPFSQQAQARSFLQRLDLMRTLDYDGVVVWSFNDWRGDRPALTVHGDDPWMHNMGLVSDRREKRLAYDAVRSVFRGEKPAAYPAGSYSMHAPIVYVLSGFVILILVAYLYNASRRFRENVNRSTLNAYNFFADVRDQHGISVFHTTSLGVIVSVACAIMASSVLFRFRESLFLDNVLSYLLVFDDLKVFVIRLIWDPLRFVLVFSPLIFLALVVLAGAVHLLRLLMKSRVFAYHAYTATVWSTTPLLAFIPVGMILYKVMDGKIYILAALVFISVFLFWVILRLFKGISIIYDIYPPKVYLAGLAVFALGVGVLYVYYDLVQSAPMYLSFLYTMVGSGR